MATPNSASAIDIDTLAVGPALDAVVAEYVFDYDVRDDMVEVIIDPDLDAPLHWRAKDTGKIVMSPQHVPNYSGELALARGVAMAMKRLNHSYMYSLYLLRETGGYDFTDWEWADPRVDAEELFELIIATSEQRCRAALKVLRMEVSQ